MSLPLEDAIMGEIGFGRHWNWYGGSGSCEGIRQAAIKKLPAAIRQHHKAGDSIAEPSDGLIGVLKRIERAEESRFTLQKTWEATATVIRGHIDYAKEPVGKRNAAFRELVEFLEGRYLSGADDSPPLRRDGSD